MEVFPHSIIGWRIWFSEPLAFEDSDFSLDKTEPGLYSIGRGEYWWQKGVNQARCNKKFSTHKAPSGDCHCGFNYYHDFEEARKDQEEFNHNPFQKVHCILGAVEGFGDTQVHYSGMRVEKARIICLVTDSTNKDYLLKDLSTTYEVPCLLEQEAKEYVKNFGVPCPSFAKPEKPAFCSCQKRLVEKEGKCSLCYQKEVIDKFDKRLKKKEKEERQRAFKELILMLSDIFKALFIGALFIFVVLYLSVNYL